MKMIFLTIALYFYHSFAVQSEYNVYLVWNLTNYEELCPTGKIPQPHPFKLASEVEEWYTKYRMCLMGWFNEATDDNVPWSYVVEDITDNESEFCYSTKKKNNNKQNIDCYSTSSVSNLAKYIRFLVDYNENNFNVREFDESFFTVYGKASGVVEIKGIGFGSGLQKNKQFEEKITFKFDENGNGVIKIYDHLDDGGIYQQIVRWSKTKFAETLSNSFTSIDENIDYFNEKNGYFQINKTIAFSVIVLSILIGIFLGVCSCIFCGKTRRDKGELVEQYSDIQNESSQDEDENEQQFIM